jgi:DnaJ-class molecular chaperone
MGKRTEFVKDSIVVCRNCKAEGTVEVDSFAGKRSVACPICGGSGLIRKHIEGYVKIEPYKK